MLNLWDDRVCRLFPFLNQAAGVEKFRPGDIADIGVLRVAPLTRLGTPMEIIKHFGGREGYLQAVNELQAEIYASSVGEAG